MRRTTMGSPDVACSVPIAFARSSLTSNPAISARLICCKVGLDRSCRRDAQMRVVLRQSLAGPPPTEAKKERFPPLRRGAPTFPPLRRGGRGGVGLAGARQAAGPAEPPFIPPSQRGTGISPPIRATIPGRTETKRNPNFLSPQREADCDEREELVHELLIAATPRPIQLEPTTRRVILPSPTITPRRIHAKVILRIEPSDNKADSPPACSRSASCDRIGGKRVSRKRKIANTPRTTDGTQRQIRLDTEPTLATILVDPCWSDDLLLLRDLGPRSSGPRRLPAAGQSARHLVGRGTARNRRAPDGRADRQVRDPGHLHLREDLA